MTPRCSPTLVRTDRHNHREVAGDSDEAGAVRILARAHQQLVWDRSRQTNRLRNALREYFPGALEAFPEHAHGDAVGVLSTAPGPREAARLSISQIRSALRRGGRQRNIERRAAEVRDALRSPQLEAPRPTGSRYATATICGAGPLGTATAGQTPSAVPARPTLRCGRRRRTEPLSPRFGGSADDGSTDRVPRLRARGVREGEVVPALRRDRPARKGAEQSLHQFSAGAFKLGCGLLLLPVALGLLLLAGATIWRSSNRLCESRATGVKREPVVYAMHTRTKGNGGDGGRNRCSRHRKPLRYSERCPGLIGA